MNTSEFWKWIADARAEAGDDDSELLEILEQRLTAGPVEQIIAFEHELYELMRRSYVSPLWGAAYLLNGGCSDDGFEYFRAWLIAQGEAVFEAALKDPDSLAVFAGDERELEGLGYVAYQAHEKKTGGVELPSRERAPYELSGEDWDEDSLEELFPRIAAKLAQ